MTRRDVEDAGRAGSKNTDTAKILNDFTLLVDSNEKSLGTHLANDGFWEAWVTSFFTFNVKPGDVVCDVGSIMGTTPGYFRDFLESKEKFSRLKQILIYVNS